MKKTLKIEVVSRTKGIVTFRIAEQSHREEGFGVGGARFTASNNIDLFSACGPDWSALNLHGGNPLLFVRGSVRMCDSDIITATPASFKRIEKAIAEYNAFEFEE